MQLFQQILHEEKNANANESFLQDLTEQFPYFGPAHFFHLNALQKDAENYSPSAARTALFFNDLFYLSNLLNKTHAPASVMMAENIELPVSKEIPAPDTISQNEALPLFEPLHATDYFASQGIRLSENANANDKLSMQLKSFTAWLKTMKKVHPEKLPHAGAAGEAAVQNLAEKSNMEEDVITEAMAEAYIQQEKPAKAKDIYAKLSLLNPSKSAYFAAKIDSLKQ